jgi:hypothetical protein
MPLEQCTLKIILAYYDLLQLWQDRFWLNTWILDDERWFISVFDSNPKTSKKSKITGSANYVSILTTLNHPIWSPWLKIRDLQLFTNDKIWSCVIPLPLLFIPNNININCIPPVREVFLEPDVSKVKSMQYHLHMLLPSSRVNVPKKVKCNENVKSSLPAASWEK